jgi:hypothetical protein
VILRAGWWPRRRVVTSLIGGLGNQMFQYAAGRALAHREGARLVLDTSPLGIKGDHTPRAYGLQAFRIQAEVDSVPAAALARMALLEEAAAGGRWPRKVHRQTRLAGHWQSEAFFREIRPLLLRDFQLAAAPSPYVAEIAGRIGAAPMPVAVHFRRGDYVTLPAAARFHGTCSLDYYRSAIDRLSRRLARLDLFVFSDDPRWVQAHAGLPAGAVICDCDSSTAAQDIWLMSLCHHHVVANSSFSWWGAWLGTREGITIAPRRWFLDDDAAQSHIVPSRWERI